MDITLRPELQEGLEQDAELEMKTVNELVNEAVARYLHDRQSATIQKESAAFVRMHPQLVRDYFGQWVAVHDGQLVDHDEDLSALYRRVRDRFGRISVLIRRVEVEPERDLVWHTPSTGKLIR